MVLGKKLQVFIGIFSFRNCWHLRLHLLIILILLLILPSFYTCIMAFLTLNFGQLLHLLDNELKNIIRNIEKQRKPIISAQYGILFHQTCLNEELYHIQNHHNSTISSENLVQNTNILYYEPDFNRL